MLPTDVQMVFDWPGRPEESALTSPKNWTLHSITISLYPYTCVIYMHRLEFMCTHVKYRQWEMFGLAKCECTWTCIQREVLHWRNVIVHEGLVVCLLGTSLAILHELCDALLLVVVTTVYVPHWMCHLLAGVGTLRVHLLHHCYVIVHLGRLSLGLQTFLCHKHTHHVTICRQYVTRQQHSTCATVTSVCE